MNRDVNLKIIEFCKVLSILVPIISLSGTYLYIWFLLKLFNIKATYYFSLSDYISSSFDVVLYVTLYVILVFLSKKKIEKYRPLNANSNNFPPNFIKYLFLFAAVAAFIMAIFSIFQGKILSSILCIFFVSYITMYFATRRYIKDSGKIQTLLAPIFLFIGSIFFVANMYYEEIRSSKGNFLTIKFAKEIGAILPDKQLVLITANSQYFFLYSISEKKTYIVPVKNINSIEAKTITKTQSEAVRENPPLFDKWIKHMLETFKL